MSYVVQFVPNNSTIQAIAYDYDSSCLQVLLLNGESYQCSSVPSEVFDSIRSAYYVGAAVSHFTSRFGREPVDHDSLLNRLISIVNGVLIPVNVE